MLLNFGKKGGKGMEEKTVNRILQEIQSVNTKLDIKLSKMNTKLDTELGKINSKLDTELNKMNTKLDTRTK